MLSYQLNLQMIAISLPQAVKIPDSIVLLQNEDELVNGLCSGSEQQFGLLYKRYAPALLGIISKIVKSEVAAEDVLQETFVKIWRSMSGFDPSRGRLFTWMASTARHAAIDHLRSRAQINSDKNTDIEEFTYELENRLRINPNPDTIGVKQLTFNLQPCEKELLDLIYFEGYTHSEAAEKLDIPLGTVKTRIRRAVSSMRQYF